MRLPTIFGAALLLLTTFTLAAQVPIIEKKKNKLSRVISESRFLSLHRELCKIESVSNDENEISKWLQHFLEAHKFKVITQEVPPNKNHPAGKKPRLNVYAYPDPKHYKDAKHKKHKDKTPPSPKVLLQSHIDTVPPHISYSLSYNQSMSKPFNRSNVLIHGRGTVDDKACVASQITVAMEFLTHPPKGLDFSPTDLALLFVVDEEAGGAGIQHFNNSTLYHSTKANYKAVLFGEPTERKLVSGHKGIFMVTISSKGKAAHSGYPWLGRSAISSLLPAVTMLDNLQNIPESEGGLPGSEKFGNTTINVGVLEGGVAANVVAEHASAGISFRLAGGTAEANQDIVEKAIAAADPEGHLTYEFTQGYGPVNLDVDVPGFDSIVVNYGTDVPHLKLNPGVKRYLYGPGTIFVAHGRNEALTVGELEAGLEGYKALLTHALQL